MWFGTLNYFKLLLMQDKNITFNEKLISYKVKVNKHAFSTSI